MLTQVEVFGPRSSLVLPIVDILGSNPIQIKNIDGLEPVDANINTTPFIVIEGEDLNGMNIGKRNIVFTFGLNPNWQYQTASDLRKLLYQYFMPMSSVRLRFTSTNIPVCEIEGWVENVKTSLFSKDPEVQVSVICPKPYFEGITSRTVFGSVLTLDMFGEPESDPTEIDYVGSVPTGMRLLVMSNDLQPSYTGPISIYVRIPDSDIKTEFSILPVKIDPENRIDMDSHPGKKYLHNVYMVYVPYDETSILGKMVDGSVWPKLIPGLNQIYVAGDLRGQKWQLIYTDRFGGL